MGYKKIKLGPQTINNYQPHIQIGQCKLIDPPRTKEAKIGPINWDVVYHYHPFPKYRPLSLPKSLF